ncbi:hypothetical protein N7454_002885 [Penicillium verhagenii]|nr:hypothetical protein N7454_002885 [Penicillium verhagenii]
MGGDELELELEIEIGSELGIVDSRDPAAQPGRMRTGEPRAATRLAYVRNMSDTSRRLTL